MTVTDLFLNHNYQTLNLHMSVFNVLPSGVNTIFPTFWKHPDALFKKGLWLAAYPLPNSLDDGRRSCGSFSTRSLPSLKHLHHSNTRVRERHSSPYCCWSLWWISADGTFSPTRNLITMRCSTLRGTFCSLITLATPRQDWTGSNPSRREGGGCGFTLSRSHSCCAVRLVYTQISPGHIWTSLYIEYLKFLSVVLL